jgi:hypothetical protein
MKTSLVPLLSSSLQRERKRPNDKTKSLGYGADDGYTQGKEETNKERHETRDEEQEEEEDSSATKTLPTDQSGVVGGKYWSWLLGRNEGRKESLMNGCACFCNCYY